MNSNGQGLCDSKHFDSYSYTLLYVDQLNKQYFNENTHKRGYV